MYGDRGQYTCVSRVDKTGFADTSQLQGSVTASATIKVYSKLYLFWFCVRYAKINNYNRNQ